MPDTTLGITYPSLTDAPEGPAQMQTLATDVDTLIAADRTARDAAWTLYTPTITGATAGTWTAGTATISTYYKRIGRTVFLQGRITWGSTTSLAGVSGSLRVSIPGGITPASGAAGQRSLVGVGAAIDASASSRMICGALIESGGTISLMRYDGTFIQPTIPFTWATGDILDFEATFESTAAP
jgi:hypothetical protein